MVFCCHSQFTRPGYREEGDEKREDEKREEKGEEKGDGRGGQVEEEEDIGG